MSKSKNSSGFKGVFSTLARSIRGGPVPPSLVSTHHSSNTTSNQKDLNFILSKLSPNSDMKDRLTAIEQIINGPENIPASKFSDIWFSVQDLFQSSNHTYHIYALRLAIVCIAKDRDNPSLKLNIYSHTVSSFSIDHEKLSLLVLKELTDNGQSSYEFFRTKERIIDVLIKWLKDTTEQQQKLPRNDRGSVASNEEPFLLSILRYIESLTTHYHRYFTKEDLFHLVHTIVILCQTTSRESDIEYTFPLLKTILKVSFLPKENLHELLLVLCSSAKFPQMSEPSWQIVELLLNSHLFTSTFLELCEIVKYTEVKDPNIRAFAGAAVFLERFVTTCANEERLNEISISMAMTAYKMSIGGRPSNLRIICSCIFNLLQNTIVLDWIPNDVWTSEISSPFEIICDITSLKIMEHSAEHRLVSGDNSSDVSSKSSKGFTHEIKEVVAKVHEILSLAADIFVSNTFQGHPRIIIDFFVNMSGYLDERCALIVVEHFLISKFCRPLSPGCFEYSSELIQRFYRDPTWGSNIRVRVLDVFTETFEEARDVLNSQEIIRLINLVFYKVAEEPDSIVLEKLLVMFVDITKDCSYEVLLHISKMFFAVFENTGKRKSFGSYISSSNEHGTPSVKSANGTPVIGPVTPIHMSSGVGGSPKAFQSMIDIRRMGFASSFCKVFAHNYKKSAINTKIAYDYLLKICEKSRNDPAAYIEVSRLLCRLRASLDNYVLLTHPCDIEDVAESVGRYVQHSDSSIDLNDLEWHYPENLSYLDEFNIHEHSYMIKYMVNPTDSKSSDYELDISRWLNEVLKALELNSNWEISSYLWVHIGPQLSNMQLFTRPGCDVGKFRRLIADQLKGSVKLKDPTQKYDIKIPMILTLSSIVPYFIDSSANLLDSIFGLLLSGISLSEKSLVPSIQTLVYCSFEFPGFIRTKLSEILDLFHRTVTNPTASPHILEFLYLIPDIPNLAINLKQSDYKKAFTIVFDYLKHLGRNSSTGNVAHKLLNISKDTKEKTNNYTHDYMLPKYSRIMAYNCIVNWYLSLRMLDRKYMTKFLIRQFSLLESHENTRDLINLAYIDFISKFTFNDIDLEAKSSDIDTDTTNLTFYDQNHWVYGETVITILTNKQFGKSFVKIRRASETNIFTVRPDPKMIPSWFEEQVVNFNNSNEALRSLNPSLLEVFSSNFMLSQLTTLSDDKNKSGPMQIPNEEGCLLLLKQIDSIPVVDSMKIGVIRIPVKQLNLQNNEVEIGPLYYIDFMNRLGDLVTLRNNRNIYLESGNDALADSKYAYTWNNKVMNLLFRATTLDEIVAHDTSDVTNRKPFIGEDYVRIYFDETASFFNFDSSDSSRNCISIVVTPILLATAKLLSEGDYSNRQNIVESKTFYSVKVYMKKGIPSLFTGSHYKVFSADSVAAYVRDLVIFASKYYGATDGGVGSIWKQRLMLIEQLKASFSDTSNNSVTAEKNPQTPSHTRTPSTDKKEVSLSDFTNQFL